jgi:hypothetical protein
LASPTRAQSSSAIGIALAWVRDGDLLEAAAHDDRSGIVFYTLEQRASERPVFKREFRCLGCHMTGETSGIPGLLMFSSRPDPSGDRHMIIQPMDHRTPYEQRFGGWFVTGAARAMNHLGNRVAALDGRQGDVSSVDGLFGSRRLSRRDERRRRAPDLFAPGPHDEPADTSVVGSASCRSGAPPWCVRTDRGGRSADERHRL